MADKPQNITPPGALPLSDDIFRMPGRSFIAWLFRFHGRPWIAACATLCALLAACALIFSDLRFLILALMAVFIITPMAMAFLYINYALHPLVACNTLPHSLRLDSDSIIITVYARNTAEENKETADGEESSGRNPEIGEDGDGAGNTVQYAIPLTSFNKYYVVKSGAIFPFTLEGKSGFIYIPQSACKSQEDFLDLITYISRKR